MAEKTLTAVNDSVQVGLDALFNGGFAVGISGTFTGLALATEGTVNGTDWFPVSVEKYNDRSVATSLTATGGAWGNAIALRAIRARVTAITTGSAKVALEVKQG